jgi:hypothetical protein
MEVCNYFYSDYIKIKIAVNIDVCRWFNYYIFKHLEMQLKKLNDLTYNKVVIIKPGWSFGILKYKD